MHGFILWLSFLSVIFQPVRGATFSEDQIKAVYLFNFAEFIRWPESAFSEHPDSFHFCALNEENPVISILKKVIRDEKVKGRKLIFRRINNLQLLKGCQVLYLQNDELSRFDEFTTEIKNSRVLSVSDQDDFVKRGGMITISRVSNRLRPTINIKRLKQAGLRASAKLLRLAAIVDGD
jgi:hypothetical protein